MWNFGWRKKAERLRMVLLTGAHQLAEELSPSHARLFELLRQAATGDTSAFIDLDQINALKVMPKAERLISEPMETHGWMIRATFYKRNGELWWLFHATRPNEDSPSEGNITVLAKILEHLGADPARDMIIGPRSSPAGEPALPFGWWTWFNRSPLFEVQIKGQKSAEKIRIVPLGSPESDGYQRLNLDHPDDQERT